MTACYGPLAGAYDRLTEDVPYGELAGWYAAALTGDGGAAHTILDLCCGTGSLSLLLAEQGFEIVGVDASAEMLSVFRQKAEGLPEGAARPLLLCQRAEELDLYGTVDGALCSLDGFNYLAPEVLPEVFRRLHLFIAPGGRLCFDFLLPERLQALDGQCFVDEGEDFLCLWRAGLEGRALRYGMDLFRRTGRGLWRREQEEHVEYLHRPEALAAQLVAAGFGRVLLREDGPQGETGRRYISAVRL